MNRILKIALLLTGLSIASVLIIAMAPVAVVADDDDNDDSESNIRQGFRIAPVELNLKGKNRALVGLGSYIVNAQGGCNDCHTNPPFAPGGDPFLDEPKKINAAHYLAGGVRFGPFTSRNITPDRSGRPAGLTLAQFLRVMRTGADLNNGHPSISPLLQVMPWPVYQDMTDRDLRAVYEYLTAIPHAEPAS
jgi:hypothetical protein